MSLRDLIWGKPAVSDPDGARTLQHALREIEESTQRLRERLEEEPCEGGPCPEPPPVLPGRGNPAAAIVRARRKRDAS